MRLKLRSFGVIASAVVCATSLSPQLSHAGDFYKPFRFLKQPFEAAHREKPATGQDTNIEKLANEIDWLEHHIDKYGSVVAKHPDIWGQSRLMRHRYEYEKEMEAQIQRFEVRMNGALRRSDQAFLGMALALQSATGKKTTVNPGTATTPATQVISDVQPTTPADFSTIMTVVNGASDPNTASILRTQPFAAVANPPVTGFTFNQPNISLEPTTQLDQMSRYLNHLHELRRINEGDDIADSPGYSLNLVRIPVSVLPGKQTQKGYGAEITIVAEPYLSEELLPTTMRNLVINDVVDQLAPVLTFIVNDEESRILLKTLQVDTKYNESGNSDKRWSGPDKSKASLYTSETLRTFSGALERQKSTHLVAVPSSKPRRARLPIPLSQVHEIMGKDHLLDLGLDIYNRLGSSPTSQPTISFIDVRSLLHEELEASYDFLKGDTFRSLWRYCDPELVNAVRERRMRWLDEQRVRFFHEICVDKGQQQIPVAGGELAHIADCNLALCGKPLGEDFLLCRTITAGLAWAIIVESSLLSERLTEDMREAAVSKGCNCVPDNCGPFYGPFPNPEACQAFNTYVRCRWPVRVFALDPVQQDQNIADAYARRREMQVAVALAFASGQLNAQSMMRYTRRLEWDMATININQTAVGFSHGNDTFGWRFHPRFQTPPVKGTLATMGESLLGGPSTNSDMKTRHLEPGIRECTAIVVMPSFVPYMTFDVRTNWFKLTNPKCTEISMRETMTLSRSIQSMKQSAAACSPCAHLYRDGEVHRLLKRVDQLDRELPLQTMQAQIPYENTSGGFELFNTGITDLAPELIGWYGAPGINPNGATTLYLIGKGFSVHSTQLTAGGRNLPFNLISRQVMQVEVPPGVQMLQRTQEGDGRFDQVVDIHLATPYGVSGHLLVNVAKAGAATRNSGGGQIAWRQGARLGLNATITVSGTAKTVTVSPYFNATPDIFNIDVPQVSPLPSTITAKLFVHASDGTFVGIFNSPSLNFDGANSSIYATGNELNSIAAGSANSIKSVVTDYANWLVNSRDFKGGNLSFRVSGALVQDGGRPLIPIENGFDVEVAVAPARP
ncbi:MAG: hypothetical protein ABL921_24580 [Pirellula sp.]